ncbi:MAG TPA: kelch repeat-containing protein, partial [Usitatibacter sp.]|nr:kelch repeat-containing protein [Usitatibacter sp.]
GDLQIPRYGHSATSLADGRIVIAGGVDDAFFVSSVGRSELYVAPEDRFHWVPSAPLPRAAHSATLLPDGSVAVAGGWINSAGRDGWRHFATTATIEIFDAATDTWRTGPDLQVPRFAHTATLLQGGALLIVGGNRSYGDVPRVTYTTLRSSELRTEAGEPSFPVAELNDARSHHTATLLANGSVLVVGGRDRDQKPIASAELLGPRPR